MDNETNNEADVTLEMKSPTEAFKGCMPLEKANSSKELSVIDAPIPLTKVELLYYDNFIMLENAMKWLIEPPKSLDDRKAVNEFLAMYAKVKTAMQAVEDGKTKVRLGRSPASGCEIVLPQNLVKTPKEETQFVMEFFLAYLAIKAGEGAVGRCKRKIKALQDALDKAGDTEERQAMRIQDLENAQKKFDVIVKDLKGPLNRSRGRLQSKRPGRIKTKPIMMRGKKRI